MNESEKVYARFGAFVAGVLDAYFTEGKENPLTALEMIIYGGHRHGLTFRGENQEMP